jgi:uncharacterized membrane protein YgdD (TMEM256/DUF423 family)
MKTFLIRFSSLSLAIAVILGALAAHTLKDKLSPELLDSFQTGVRYQLVHSLALLVLAALEHVWYPRMFRIGTTLMIMGMIFFSGSIYLLSTQSLTGVSLSGIGIVTPLGGLCMVGSWFVMGFGINTKP